MERGPHSAQAPGRGGCILLALLLSAAASGCARSAPDQASPSMNSAPTIVRLDPATGWAGEAYPISVTIHGERFAAVGNRVTFGTIEIDDRPSSEDGTQIVFAVPKVFHASGEAPPQVLQPAEYAVRVTNDHGTSEPVVFTLTHPGDR